MSLSTPAYLLLGAAFIGCTAAAVVVVNSKPTDPDKPTERTKPLRQRPAEAPPRTVEVTETVIPGIELADEVMVFSEAPLHFEYSPTPITAESQPISKVQHFGHADPNWGPPPAQPTTIDAGVAWLADHQAEDGSWRPDLFHEDSKRKVGKRARPEDADGDTRIAVTAMAALALISCESEEAGWDVQKKALDFLDKQVGEDGWVEPDSPYGVQTQALVFMALYKSGTHENAAAAAWHALESARLNNSGWPAKKGGSKPDRFASELAFEALTFFKRDSVTKQMDRQAMGTASREATGGGFWGSAGAQAQLAAEYALMEAADDSFWQAQSREDQRDELYSDTLVDFQYIWALARAQFFYDSEWLGWTMATRDALMNAQVGERPEDKGKKGIEAERGSWDPDEGLAKTGGRVAATAMAIYALTLLDEKQEGTARDDSSAGKSGKSGSAKRGRKKKDRDRDGTADAIENDGTLPTICACGPTLFAMHNQTVRAVMPLHKTAIDAAISGVVVSASVTQTYANTLKTPIEAVYCFPLPHGGAITDFTLTTNGRTIRGVIRPRAEAEKIYSEAIARGQTAALLNRETGNVFNHYIGNIAPGAEVEVSLNVFERVKVEDGWHEWAMPLVVGPYYIAGSAVESEDKPDNRVKGHGIERDTDRVPNASFITPPVLAEGEVSTNKLEINVDLEAGFPIKQLESVQHDVEAIDVSPSRRTLTLLRADEKVDRDFVLRWQIASDWTKPALLAHNSGDEGYFTLMLTPPLTEGGAQAPREITFIMDISGSMSGQPIECCKQLVNAALDDLTPADKFNVFFFSGRNGQVFSEPQLATSDNIASARQAVGNFKAGGGTEMLAGLQRALEGDHDDRYLQTYAFLTDGNVGEVDAILRYVELYGDKVQFFAFGVGKSVNRALIDGVAASGNGRAIYYLPGDDIFTHVEPINAFLRSIRNPVAASPTIDWGGLPVKDVVPGELNNVYFGQILSVTGRYAAAANGKISVSWTSEGVEQFMEVELALPDTADNPALRQLWASARIYELEQDYLMTSEPALLAQITELAVKHRLATRSTSFVAVDENSKVGKGNPKTIVQPVELPDGVDREGVGR